MTTTKPARALRSNTTLAANPITSPATTTTTTLAPSKKRKASALVEKFTCVTCLEDKPSRVFPEYNPSPDCEHLINTCKACLRKWVEGCVEGASFKTGRIDDEMEEGTKDDGDVKEEEDEKANDKGKEIWGIPCPECEAVMRAVNVQMAVPKKVFNRFDELERKHVADTTPNWRWCLSPSCRAGQVHIPKPTAPKEKEEEEGPPQAKRTRRGKNPLKFLAKSKPAETKATEEEEEADIMTCTTCSFRSCTRCDRPMHDGETCTAYQVRIKDRLEEEDKALKKVAEVSKPCPKCRRAIQKNGGCPSMVCSQCNVNFCWNCLQVFGRMGCGCTRPPPPPPQPLAGMVFMRAGPPNQIRR